ncbi:hypothetical protein POVWA2_015250 [Plasmodium ovale wallikeri]|uniref:Uncharacterized protein n=1 Tax=Plasmodium ovale wallikeri TaxID=864142 RepID=A0A1A8YQ45_PLAOA|nr:hypothetical protein POVWA2_015250 [Plasmodium ovale wallikeri]SBT34343.1 hypothetical protein POVWA1_021780 [Plasmodium ovale wallikeri]
MEFRKNLLQKTLFISLLPSARLLKRVISLPLVFPQTGSALPTSPKKSTASDVADTTRAKFGINANV